jgi:hypothetical protein
MSARELEILTKALGIIVMVTGACFAAVSGILTSNIATGGNPITPDLYGPEIYATPALVWTSLQEKAALLMMVGAMMVASGSRWWRVGAVMICLGGAGLAYLMGTLTYYAANAPQGIVIYAMCLGFGLPAAVISAGIGVAIIVIEKRAA